MIGITLDLQPGEDAFFQVGERYYRLSCADSGRALAGSRTAELPDSSNTRQLALEHARREEDLPEGVTIRHEQGVWVGYDSYTGKVIVWSHDRDLVKLLTAQYSQSVRRQAN